MCESIFSALLHGAEKRMARFSLNRHLIGFIYIRMSVAFVLHEVIFSSLALAWDNSNKEQAMRAVQVSVDSLKSYKNGTA